MAVCTNDIALGKAMMHICRYGRRYTILLLSIKHWVLELFCAL